MTGEKQYDVIIVGGGNAALTAALASANEGAKTLMVEKAPEYLRGGNSYFTGGLFRFAYEGLEDILGVLDEMSEEEQAGIDVGSYNQAAFYSDIMRVTEGLSDPQLIQTLVGQSYPTMKWMKDEGVPWILAYGRQAFRHEGILRFWGGLIVEAVGAGKGLSDSLFEIVEKRGVDVRYETKATALRTDNQGKIVGLTVKGSNGFQDLDSDSVILACGGFEANPEMRTRYLGPGWELAKVRGTQFNTGDGIRMALDIGAQSFGHWSGCHAVAWDLNAPPYGDRNIADLFQKHSYPFGIMVSFAGIVFNGVLDRYPRVRFGFVEAGAGWLMAAMERFTGSWASHVQYDPRGRFLQLRPKETIADYIMRHIDEDRIYVGVEGDELTLPSTISVVGNKPFVYSSDFPHEVNNETCAENIRELRENTKLSADDKEAMLYRNGKRLYGLA